MKWRLAGYWVIGSVPLKELLGPWLHLEFFASQLPWSEQIPPELLPRHIVLPLQGIQYCYQPQASKPANRTEIQHDVPLSLLLPLSSPSFLFFLHHPHSSSLFFFSFLRQVHSSGCTCVANKLKITLNFLEASASSTKCRVYQLSPCLTKPVFLLCWFSLVFASVMKSYSAHLFGLQFIWLSTHLRSAISPKPENRPSPVPR